MPASMKNTLSLTFRYLPMLFLTAASSPASEWGDIKDQYKTAITVAGLGQANGDNNPDEWNDAEGLPALQAELSEPHSAMADVRGRIFVADKNAHAIRRIDPDGNIHTVAGMNLSEITGEGDNAGYDGDGPAREHLLDGPQHAYVLPDGTFYILDSGNRRVRKVGLDGMMKTLVKDTVSLNRGLWVSRDEALVYYCTNTELKRWSPGMGENPGVVLASGFQETGNIDVDRFGNIYVTDRAGSAVYRVPFSHDGTAVTPAMIVAGTADNTDSGDSSNGKKATKTGLLEVRGIAFHPLGGYFLATHKGGDIWYVDTEGEVHMLIQGNDANAHNPGPFSVPATGGNEISEVRSISVALNGDLVIASNDAGFIRVVRSVLPKPAPPAWDTVNLTPDGFRLRWQTEPGKSYLLEKTTDLKADAWVPLLTTPAAGTTLEFTAPVPSAEDAPGTFFRLHEFRRWPN